MDRTHPDNRSQANQDESLPAGVTALSIALVVTSFALFLAPLFS